MLNLLPGLFACILKKYLAQIPKVCGIHESALLQPGSASDPALGSVPENSPWQASETSSRRVSSVFIPGWSQSSNDREKRVGDLERSVGLRWKQGSEAGGEVSKGELKSYLCNLHLRCTGSTLWT